MGYMKNHAIIVTGFQEESMKLAHAKAIELFGLTIRQPEGAYNWPLAEVTEITPASTNSHRSFMVAPDGSKEGWGQSDSGDQARQAFIEWLSGQYSHGHYFSYVEVSYGEDDYEPAKIVTDSNEINLKRPDR